MNWLRKARPLLFVTGGLLVIGSLLGARLLTHGSGGATDLGKAAPPPTNGEKGSGPVVLGFVDSDPPPVAHGLPPVLQSGEIVEMFVKQGDEVKAGAKLYKFDTTILEADLNTALRAVDTAAANVNKAKGAVVLHGKKVDLQKQMVAAAETKVKLSHDAWQLAENNLKDGYKAAGFDPAGWAGRLKNEVKLFELYKDHTVAQLERDLQKAQLADLEAARENQVDKLVAEAEAEVKRYDTLVAKARSAILLCTVTAKVAGTVERVNVSPGEVMGISTRTPAVVLVPAGPRVVRAEVEAEFAHRIGTDRIGKEVTIFDNSDPKLTYKGVVRQISGSFLAKRGMDGGFVPNETRVLEAVVEVADPSPPGRPPLRVGQKVRVNFGQ